MRFLIEQTERYKVEGEMAGMIFALHLHVYKWSPSTYKELLNLLIDIQEWAKNNSFNALYTGAPNGDEKIMKCQRMFGFEPFSEDEDMVYMYQRIV